MREYQPEEIQREIIIRGGDEIEQAAALAVVQAAITESRRLGRVALPGDQSRWQRQNSLREGLQQTWSTPLR